MSLVKSETVALNGIVYIAAGTDISLPEVYLLSSLAKMGVDKGSQSCTLQILGLILILMINARFSILANGCSRFSVGQNS